MPPGRPWEYRQPTFDPQTGQPTNAPAGREQVGVEKPRTQDSPVGQPDPGTPTQPTGDANSRAQWANQNIDSRVSIEQWVAWDQYYDPSCPPDTPYRSYRGNANNSCQEKPVDCPSGTTLHGENCIPLDQVPGGGGGGGGGGAGGAGGGGGAGGSSFTSQSSQLPPYQAAPFNQELYDRILGGIDQARSGPYDQATIDRQKALLFQQSQASAQAQKQALGQDLVRRGVSRSGAAVEQTAEIERNARAEYGKNYTAVLIRAAEQNYGAKITALNHEQQLLSTWQQTALSNARNDLDRNIANANATLGYARIDAERRNLESQLAAAYRLANLNNEAALVQLLVGANVGIPPVGG